MDKALCPKCNRRVWGETEHPLCVSSDVTKIYVVHDFYGCDTGCCGHQVTVINTRGEKLSFFHFDHPYYESDKSFIKRMIKDTFNSQHLELDFDLIDYESCELSED